MHDTVQCYFFFAPPAPSAVFFASAIRELHQRWLVACRSVGLLLTSFLFLSHDRSLRFLRPLKLRAGERILLLLQVGYRQHAALDKVPITQARRAIRA